MDFDRCPHNPCPPPPTELPDEVAHVRQAEDRAHRQGQRHPVNIYFLCAKGTTDDRRWQHLNRSLARVAAVHDGAGLAPAGALAHGEAEAAGGADGAGGVEAAGAGWQDAAAAAAAVEAQAGLLVEHVYDADVAGLTQAAAKAGWGLAATPPRPATGSCVAHGAPGGEAAAGTAGAGSPQPMPMEVEEAVGQVLSGLVAAVATAERGAGPGEPPCSEAAAQQAAAAAFELRRSPRIAAKRRAAAGREPAPSLSAPRPAAPASAAAGGTAGEHCLQAAPAPAEPVEVSLCWRQALLQPTCPRQGRDMRAACPHAIAALSAVAF